MAFMLYSIDEAIDCKFIITKTMSGQAKVGSLIHVMDTKENSDGITVFYRITKTGQNFVAKFETLKDFCKWCTPDSFIARHYDQFSKKEILHYLSVSNRTMSSFYLPVIIVLCLIAWILMFVVFKSLAIRILLGLIFTACIAAAVFFIGNNQKDKMLMKFYSRVNSKLKFK